MTDLVNAVVLLANFVLVPATVYGCQLALGALGVTLVYGVLRFSNFAHGETMAFGAMATILVTWLLQSAEIGIAPLPTALLALPAGIVAGGGLCLVTDRWVYRFLPPQEGGAGDPDGGLGGRHVRAQRADPVPDRPGRPGVHRRHPIRRQRAPVQGSHRAARGPGDQDHADDHGGGDRAPGAVAVLVPRPHADRQVDARLLGQRGPGAAVRHQPGTGGGGHLDHRRRARGGGRHAVRPGQELQAVRLPVAAAADLRRRHRRRPGQSARRHRGRLRGGVLGGAAHLPLQEVPRLPGTGGLAPGGPGAVALHRLQVRHLVLHPGGGAAVRPTGIFGGRST